MLELHTKMVEQQNKRFHILWIYFLFLFSYLFIYLEEYRELDMWLDCLLIHNY